MFCPDPSQYKPSARSGLPPTQTGGMARVDGSASEPRVGTKVERGRWRVGWGWDKALTAIAIRLDRTNRAFSAPRSLGKIRYLQLALLSDAPCVVVLSK